MGAVGKGLETMVGMSPNWGCGTPSKWSFCWLVNGGSGVTNYLLTGMALQVVGPHVLAKTILILANDYINS